MFSRLLAFLIVTVSALTAHTADVRIDLDSSGVVNVGSGILFGAVEGAATTSVGSVVVDNASSDVQFIPAGTFIAALGVSLSHDVTLLGRTAVKSIEFTVGNVTFNQVSDLVDFYWLANPHVLAIVGTIPNSGNGVVSFQVQNFSYGDYYWGSFSCADGTLVCSMTNDGGATDYNANGNAQYYNATVAFTLVDTEVVKTPAEQVADMKALVQSYPIKNIVKSTLNAQLVLIERVLQRNGPNATQYAIRLTKAFIDTVNFLARRGQLTTAQADELNAAATVLITTLTAN